MELVPEVREPSVIPPYNWETAYQLEYSADALTITIRVHFDEPLGTPPWGGPGWEWEIEQIWSNKAFVASGDNAPVPIVLDLIQTGPENAHHIVDVVQGPGPTHMNTWFMGSMNELVAAHEIGHMLGLPDEYPGGATTAVRWGVLMSNGDDVPLDYFKGVLAVAQMNFDPSLVLVAPAGETSDGGVAGLHVVGSSVKDKLVGFRYDDLVEGRAANDTLRGFEGNDVLVGGAGRDKLYGGSGEDTFVFNGKFKGAPDVLVDYLPADDTIQLSRSYFKALPAGPLSSDAFNAGGKEQTDDRILYENGKLFYDRDGKGGHDPVVFAKAAGGIALTEADFIVV